MGRQPRNGDFGNFLKFCVAVTNALALALQWAKPELITRLKRANIALMQDNLRKVVEAIQLGWRTVRIIQTNIALALGVKAIFLALALSGHASLWLAILADTGATLVVIANAV